MPLYKRILLAVDLREDTPRIAQRAKELAEIFGADLHLIHVLEPMPLVTSMTSEAVMSMPIETQQTLTKETEQRLQGVAKQLGLPETAYSMEVGNVKTEILRVAHDLGVDLIVLGSKERHGLSVLVDFTEDTVLHKAPCDVLAIRV